MKQDGGRGEFSWESVGEKTIRGRMSVGVFRRGLEGMERMELGEKRGTEKGFVREGGVQERKK